MLKMLQLNVLYTINLKISYNVIEEIFTLSVLGENEIGFWNGKMGKKNLNGPKNIKQKCENWVKVFKGI